MYREQRLRRFGETKGLQVMQDDKAAEEGYLRIVDESGEDYLYPESYFISVELPRKVQDALRISR